MININNKSSIIIAIVIGLLVSTLMSAMSLILPSDIDFEYFMVPLILLLILAPFSKLSAVLLLISIVLTEFYWIEIAGGYLKPFHIISIILFATYSAPKIRILKSSRICWYLIIFIVINMISIMLSNDALGSMRSFILPIMLFSIAINIAVVLYTGKIGENKFINIFIYSSLIAVLFAFAQMFAYSFAGTLLTLTDAQVGQIVIAKRPPSFFTEADTFGKYLSLPFLFLLPYAVTSDERSIKWKRAFVMIIFMALILNMTRSSLIGIGFAFMMYIFYIFKQRRIAKGVAIAYSIIAALIFLVPIIYFTVEYLGSHSELDYRIQTLVNPSIALLEDPSIIYRRRSVVSTLNAATESIGTFIMGKGWGASIMNYRGEVSDVGGSLFINILYFGGVMSLVVFILAIIHMMRVCVNMVRAGETSSQILFVEGVLFSFIGMLTISQVSSMWIAPEFWVVIGCLIYLELILRKRKIIADQ